MISPAPHTHTYTHKIRPWGTVISKLGKRKWDLLMLRQLSMVRDPSLLLLGAQFMTSQRRVCVGYTEVIILFHEAEFFFHQKFPRFILYVFKSHLEVVQWCNGIQNMVSLYFTGHLNTLITEAQILLSELALKSPRARLGSKEGQGPGLFVREDHSIVTCCFWFSLHFPLHSEQTPSFHFPQACVTSLQDLAFKFTH